MAPGRRLQYSLPTTMFRTLLLKKDERVFFEKLPDSLKQGWVAEEETLAFQDTDAHRRTRCQMMRIRDPRLHELRRKMVSAGSLEEAVMLAKSITPGYLDPHDLAEIMFGLGPDVVSVLIRDMLRSATQDRHIERVLALSRIRHNQLQAFVPSYSSVA